MAANPVGARAKRANPAVVGRGGDVGGPDAVDGGDVGGGDV